MRGQYIIPYGIILKGIKEYPIGYKFVVYMWYYTLKGIVTHNPHYIVIYK
jgi:hypothetical protein